MRSYRELQIRLTKIKETEKLTAEKNTHRVTERQTEGFTIEVQSKKCISLVHREIWIFLDAHQSISD